MFQSIGYGVTSDQHLNKFSGYYYGGTVSKSTIMIINDNSFVLDGLIAIMKKKGYRIVAAHNHEDGVSFLSTTVPDLILLDMTMEQSGGCETLKFIIRNQVLSDVPVIMFSAQRGYSGDICEFRERVSAVIEKPINTRVLMNAIDCALKDRKIAGGKDEVCVPALARNELDF